MLVDLIKVYVLAAVFVLHCAIVGLGALAPLHLWRKLGEDSLANLHLQWFFSICAGLFVNISILFVLGLLGGLTVPLVLAAGALVLMVAAPAAVRHMRNERLFRLGDAAPMGALVLTVLLFITAVSAFHAPGHFDDTLFHLPLARHYLQHEAIALADTLRFPLFPQNINLIIMLGLMLGGDVAAQAFASLPLFVISLGLIGASRAFLGSATWGVLASFLLLTLGPIKRTIGYAYVDDGLALFCWATALAIAVWAAQQKGGKSSAWVVLAAVMAGAAAGSKYFGGVFAVVAGCYLLLWRRDLRTSCVYGAVVLLTGTWWYIRSFILSGDPVHPAGGNLFGHFLWNAGDLALQKQEQASFGTPRNPVYVLSALKEAGVAVWVSAFASLALRRVAPAIRSFQLIFLVYFFFWFYVTQVMRYLAPVYAVGCFLSCYTVYRLFETVASRFNGPRWQRGRTLAGYVMLALLAIYAADRYQKYASETARQDAILADKPGYLLFNAANALIPELGDRLVQLGFEGATYFFNGTVIGDWFGPGRYRNMLECTPQGCQVLPSEKMKNYLMEKGSRMLAVSTLDYPGFDPSAYEADFEVVERTARGVLLRLK